MKAKRKKAGHPTLYNKEILVKTRKYITSCEDKDVQLIKQENEEKGYVMYENKYKVNLPSLEGLSFYLKVHKDTIQEWKNKYKQFSVLIGELLTKQARALINNGLSGNYNPTIAKLLLSKHGYIEKTENDHTSKGEKIEAINYIIPSPHDSNHRTDV